MGEVWFVQGATGASEKPKTGGGHWGEEGGTEPNHEVKEGVVLINTHLSVTSLPGCPLTPESRVKKNNNNTQKQGV